MSPIFTARLQTDVKFIVRLFIYAFYVFSTEAIRAFTGYGGLIEKIYPSSEGHEM